MNYVIEEKASRKQVSYLSLPWAPDSGWDALQLGEDVWLVESALLGAGQNRRIVVRKVDASELVSLGVRVLWRRRGMEMRPTYRMADASFASPPAPSEGRKSYGWSRREEKDLAAETLTVKDDAP